MVLGVGLVSACILWKKRPGALTRLQKLQKRLKQKPIQQKTLYSYPIKYLFLIFTILCFIGGLKLFLNEYKREIQQKYQFREDEIPEDNLKLFNTPPKKQQYRFSRNEHKLDDINTFIPTHQATIQLESSQSSIELIRQYYRVQRTIYIIILIFIIPILALISQLKFQKLIIRSKQLTDSNQIAGYVQINQLNMFGKWKQTNKITCSTRDIFFIQLCGDDRFSHKNTYYAIKMIQKQSQCQNNSQQNQRITLLHQYVRRRSNRVQQNVESRQTGYEQKTIKKFGSIYQTRQALVYLCHILKKQLNLQKIKNGPIKQKKKPNQNKNKNNIKQKNG